ncbi:hypothetical protein COU61_01575 [Candidatus Pacearchaeota archaeon CG10_big_fil_rev_8_21_14_0_10_35_13]|nr:MAG: hypothetical protein COU61_01575 [Candidatus Pacearchaeota archaeon CG10_big_fil_rev_8_21_14_0_10_35_13]
MVENLELTKAQIMFKLMRKNNWDNKYDRTEHFKRFQGLDDAIKELLKKEWLIVHKKPAYTGIALNSQYKKEIIEFIVDKMSQIRDLMK